MENAERKTILCGAKESVQTAFVGGNMNMGRCRASPYITIGVRTLFCANIHFKTENTERKTILCEAKESVQTAFVRSNMNMGDA